jgi:hypothetical protein
MNGDYFATCIARVVCTLCCAQVVHGNVILVDRTSVYHILDDPILVLQQKVK